MAPYYFLFQKITKYNWHKESGGGASGRVCPNDLGLNLLFSLANATS